MFHLLKKIFKTIEETADLSNGVLSQIGGLTEDNSTTINIISDILTLVKMQDKIKPNK